LETINDAIKDMWDRILGTTGGKAFLMTTSADLTVTAGTATVALPADAGVEISLVEVKFDDTYRPLRTFNLPERSDDTVITQSEKLGTRYRVMGTNILLSPTPAWGGYIRVWYVPVPTAVTAATNHNFFFGWDRVVWNKVCQMHALSRGEEKAAAQFQTDYLLALDGITGRCSSARTPSANFIRDDYAEIRRSRYPWYRRRA
jgi:hypothetical protein